MPSLMPIAMSSLMPCPMSSSIPSYIPTSAPFTISCSAPFPATWFIIYSSNLSKCLHTFCFTHSTLFKKKTQKPTQACTTWINCSVPHIGLDTGSDFYEICKNDPILFILNGHYSDTRWSCDLGGHEVASARGYEVSVGYLIKKKKHTVNWDFHVFDM